MKSFCKDCVWAVTNEKLDFCEKMQHSYSTSCSRHYRITPDIIGKKNEGKKCECGAEAAGGGQHSDYCPKHLPTPSY